MLKENRSKNKTRLTYPRLCLLKRCQVFTQRFALAVFSLTPIDRLGIYTLKTDTGVDEHIAQIRQQSGNKANNGKKIERAKNYRIIAI